MNKFRWIKFKYKLKQYTIDAIRASILCLRFPFLYPRNRFSGLHYNNWKILDYCSSIYHKYGKLTKEEPISKVYYYKKVTNYNQYWTNWWAKWVYDIIKFYHDVVLQIIYCIPTFTELDSMPKGWRKAFGIQMCEEIKYYLKKNKCLYSYRITQIKEKWGCLHWYDCGAPVEVSKTISKYECISKHTCIDCGEHATACTPIEYWASPYCDKCFPNNSKYRIIFGLEDNPWYDSIGNVNRYSTEQLEEYKQNYNNYLDIRQ